jgi:putative flippase GtrA
MQLVKYFYKHPFVRFCIVGGLGFVINFALLSLFYKYLRWPLFIAQLLAAEIALFNNFLFHHNWTYKSHNVEKTIVNLLVQFHVTSWVAIVGSAALVSLGVNSLHLHYFIALVITSIIALGWNFLWTRFVIWRHPHKELPAALQHDKSSKESI